MNLHPIHCLILLLSGAPAWADTPVTIELDRTALQSTGIATVKLTTAKLESEFVAYGQALSIEPLLALRHQYSSATAQHAGTHAKLYEARQHLQRIQALHSQDIVSTHRLQEQQAQWQASQAQLSADASQSQWLLASGKQQWGETLTNWFTQAHSPQADALISRVNQLLQIVLPAGRQMPPDTKRILIAADGRREHAGPATLIAAAPLADPITQGMRYFFETSDKRLQPGMRVTAWITEHNDGETGVLIPKPALIHDKERMLVFVKSGEGRYVTRTIPQYTATDTGYFIKGPLQAGEELVTIGAQLLLSQMLKTNMPDEDRD